jgi:hypothetical protein
MYDTTQIFSLHLPIFYAASIFIVTRVCEFADILKTNNDSDGNKQLLLGAFFTGTALKSLNEFLKADIEIKISDFIDFAIDTIVILPPIVSIWQPGSNALSHGVHLATALAILPTYVSKTTSDIAKYLVHYKEVVNNTSSCHEDSSLSYEYAVTKGIIPAFTRGIIFFKLKEITNNDILSALIAGSTMGAMLENSDTYTSASLNIAIKGLNAAANKLRSLQFQTMLDSIYPQSSTMIAIEFAEYFIYSIEIEKRLHNETNNSYHYDQDTFNENTNNSNIDREL